MKKILMMAAATMMGAATVQAADTDITAMANALYVQGATVQKGKTAQLKLQLKNDLTNVQSIGAYIQLPTGVTATAATLESRADLTPTKTGAAQNTVQINTVDGVTRLALLGCSGEAITGTDGAVVTLDVTIADDAVAGNYPVEVYNVELCTLDSKATEPASVTTTLAINDGVKGDVNMDGKVDTADINSVLEAMSGGTVAGSADVNEDTKIDTADINSVLDIMSGN